MENIMTRKLYQYKYEVNSWRRILEFIRQENILVKNHLADVIRFSEAEEYLLNDVEFLINNLLQIETAVTLIYKDIEPYEKLIDKEFFIDGSNKKMLHQRQSILKDIRTLESEFNKIKHQVDSFLYNTLLS